MTDKSILDLKFNNDFNCHVREYALESVSGRMFSIFLLKILGRNYLMLCCLKNMYTYQNVIGSNVPFAYISLLSVWSDLIRVDALKSDFMSFEP